MTVRQLLIGTVVVGTSLAIAYHRLPKSSRPIVIASLPQTPVLTAAPPATTAAWRSTSSKRSSGNKPWLDVRARS